MKNLFRLLSIVSICLGSSLPALADNDMGTMAKNTAMFPVRVLSLGSGLIVGTPIAVLRCSFSRSKEYTEDFADQVGGKDKIPSVIFASLPGIPCGVLVGSAEGVYYGGKDAISNCVEHPFNKETFSLGDKLE